MIDEIKILDNGTICAREISDGKYNRISFVPTTCQNILPIELLPLAIKTWTSDIIEQYKSEFPTEKIPTQPPTADERLDTLEPEVASIGDIVTVLEALI